MTSSALNSSLSTDGRSTAFYQLSRDVNNAVEEFFLKGFSGQAASGGSSISQSQAQQVFDRYKDKGTGNIEIEGLQQFFEDLGINGGTDIITMYISYKMNEANMGTITQQEFMTGFRAMNVSTMEDLKKRVPQLNNDLKAPDEFKKMYKFIYHFARDKANKNM